MTEAGPQVSQKQRFWTTWQSFVGIPGVLLLGWLLLGPEDLQLPVEQVTMIWLGLFAVAAVAGFIRLKLSPDR